MIPYINSNVLFHPTHPCMCDTLTWCAGGRVRDGLTLTLLRVLTGLRRVSVMERAGGLRGLLEGVWTAQHLMNTPMNTTKPTPSSITPYQYCCTKEERISYQEDSTFPFLSFPSLPLTVNCSMTQFYTFLSNFSISYFFFFFFITILSCNTHSYISPYLLHPH